LTLDTESPAPDLAKAAESPRIGAKIRRLRRARGQTQAALAQTLGVSSSYLNLIEHNRRKITVALLLKLSEVFGVEIRELAEDAEGRLVADLMEALGDDLFEETDVTNTDVREMVTASPATGRAMLRLFDAYKKARDDLRGIAEQFEGEDDDAFDLGPRAPDERVGDFIQERRNHFPDLEEEAERLVADINRDRADEGAGVAGIGFGALADYVKRAFGARVLLLAPVIGPRGPVEVRTRFDAERGTIEVSNHLPVPTAKFQLARAVGLHVSEPVISMLLKEGGIADAPAADIGRAALGNYLAAAILMPYRRFLASAEAQRHDIELLQTNYGASFEQICHRLTTLNRPGETGVPFHMVRVDPAGRISKRISLSGLHLPRHGRAEPDWIACQAFQTPGMLRTQVTRMADERTFFSVASTVRKGAVGYHAPKQTFAIELGCEASFADKLVYADGWDMNRPDVVRSVASAV